MNTPIEHATALISAVHPIADERHLIEITGLAYKMKPVKRYFTDAQIAAEYALSLNAVQYNAFFGVCPRREFSGLESAVVETPALFLDFDAKHGGLEAARTAAEKLARYGIPPSVEINSGHGAHFYLLLAEPADPAFAKRSAERLCGATSSDRTFNQNRIARLPGTLNWKDTPLWCHITGWWPERRYLLDAIDSALDAMGAPMPKLRRMMVEPRRPENPIESENWWLELAPRLSPHALAIIESGEKNPFSDGQLSRSEADWFVICALIRADATDEQIRWVYLNRPIGDLKFRQSGYHYLNQTIESARYAMAEPATATPPSGGRYSSARRYSGSFRDSPGRRHEKY